MAEEMIIQYEWRPTPGWKFIGDVYEIGLHIEKIAEAKGGFLTTPDIVDDACNPKSPLHPNFEWDDPTAAELWRHQTARALIGSIYKIKVEQNGDAEREVRVRAFINVVVDDQHYYSPVNVVMSVAVLRKQYLDGLVSEAMNLKRRAANFEEFAGVVEAIDQLPVKLGLVEVMKLEG